jgi:hypothetical protein
MQVVIGLIQIEEVGFLFSKKPRCPFVNQVVDNIFAPMNQPFACALENLFGDVIFPHFYKPLDPNAWPKSRNVKKIYHLDMFKLSILQENKWEVGCTLETTLLIPSNNPPLGYGWIYHLLLGSPKNRKQYEVTISDHPTCNCMDFSSTMATYFNKQGLWVPCKHLYYILQDAMYLGLKNHLSTIHPTTGMRFINY